MIKKYRKTSAILAEPFDESNELVSKYHMITKNGAYYLPTKEGNMKVKYGDLIATGIDGEHWAIDREIFSQTYVECEGRSACPFCHGRPYVEVLSPNVQFELHESDHNSCLVYDDGVDRQAMLINYCPMCGRKLND